MLVNKITLIILIFFWKYLVMINAKILMISANYKVQKRDLSIFNFFKELKQMLFLQKLKSFNTFLATLL